MVKLWLAHNRQDERNVFATEIQIQNISQSRDLLYDPENLRLPNEGMNHQEEQDKKGQDTFDMNSDHEFDIDCDELLHIGNSLENNFKKVNRDQIKRERVRDFIL